MKLLALLALPFLALVLSGCVEQPTHRQAGQYAQVRSWFTILEIDGEPPEDPYAALVEPGGHQIVVLYKTYRAEYVCRFEMSAVGGQTYEIVDHSNPQPLVMYRWVRANGAWAERIDPVDPTCINTSLQAPGALSALDTNMPD